MIFAKVDVKLRDHERAHRAGAAMATWTWGLLYAREQESDGFIPDVAIRGSWVGEKDSRRHAAQLVLVGLWEVVDGGWRICRYGEKNETKAVIAQRRAEAAERMQRVRANRHRTSSEHPPNTLNENRPTVPGSGFVLEDQDKGVRDPSARAKGPPDWFRAAIATADQAGCPVPDSDVFMRWVQYDGAPSRHGKPKSQQDAAAWLIATVRGDRERAATEQAKRERYASPKQPEPAKAPYHAIAPKNRDDETRAPPEVAKTALGNLAKMFQPPGGTK